MTHQQLSLDDVRDEARRQLALRKAEDARRQGIDVEDWANTHYWVIDEITRQPRLIKLAPHQAGVLRLALAPGEGRETPYSLILLSTVKKSGKTALAGVVARYIAEVKTRFGEVYCIGNDLDQAKGRSFESIGTSIKLTPGATQKAGDWVLPGRYVCQKTQISCLSSGTYIRAIAVDARGEAGSNPDLSIWTELWGFEYEEALRFWDEMTPVPTKPHSMRLVETYAGYDGSSKLLMSLYDQGLTGQRLTNHEFATAARRSPEDYETYLHAFEELGGDPEAPTPIYINQAAGLFMYWDDGVQARRMPWQKGDLGKRYYVTQEAQLRPEAYRRLHENKWAGDEGAFVPMDKWDACKHNIVAEYKGEPGTLPYFMPGDRTPVVLAVDAASTSDCFGIVAVTRHPAHPRTHVAVRAVRRYDPPPGGRIDYAEPEAFIREVCSQYNVVQITYDPYQLEQLSQALRRDGIWCDEFPQMGDRLRADRALYDRIMRGELAHDGNEQLREHILNANAKLQKDEDSKMRIVKRAAGRKIDLAVCTSMAAYRCMYLLLA